VVAHRQARVRTPIIYLGTTVYSQASVLEAHMSVPE
jgi:hypothetical protein